jgi:hypothetical protein
MRYNKPQVSITITASAPEPEYFGLGAWFYREGLVLLAAHGAESLHIGFADLKGAAEETDPCQYYDAIAKILTVACANGLDWRELLDSAVDECTAFDYRPERVLYEGATDLGPPPEGWTGNI